MTTEKDTGHYTQMLWLTFEANDQLEAEQRLRDLFDAALRGISDTTGDESVSLALESDLERVDR